MQAKDVIIPARRDLQDDQGARFSDMVLFGFLADGIAQMLRERPDLLLAIDGTFSDGDGFAGGAATGGYVRIRNGRLEVWDDGLQTFIAVSFQNGALIPLVNSNPVDPDAFMSADGITLSLSTEIPIDDPALIAPLVDYVVYRGKRQYAQNGDDQNTALTYYNSFVAKLGRGRR